MVSVGLFEERIAESPELVPRRQYFRTLLERDTHKSEIRVPGSRKSHLASGLVQEGHGRFMGHGYEKDLDSCGLANEDGPSEVPQPKLLHDTLSTFPKIGLVPAWRKADAEAPYEAGTSLLSLPCLLVVVCKKSTTACAE